MERGLSIGNALHSGGLSFNGEIDDVKIWRLNPRRFDDEFYSRPMASETADCWKRLRREMDDAFRRHPDCAKQIGSAVKSTIEGLMRKAVAKGPGDTEAASRILRRTTTVSGAPAQLTAPRW